MASDKAAPHPSERRTKVDISLLQTFHVVARTGSFSAASRALNVSYQSAANHVRRLEQIYGAALIKTEKGARGITLTPLGRALHASLGDELETILSRLSVLLHDVRSVLRVGVTQALFHHFFPDILKIFRADSPDIELAFYERDTTLEKMMMEGALDAAVSERSFTHPGITQHLLGTYKLVLIYPIDWRLPPLAPPQTKADLSFFRERPFITYEAGQMVRSGALDYLSRQMQAPPRIDTSASGSTSVTRLVQAGLGYGVVPDWSLGPESQKVGKIMLEEMEPMKLWFAHSAFLETNKFVRLLHKACLTTINKNRNR
jgi:LysR family transcriptional regulator, low CO2-responsive transcriptional regulator